MIHASWPTMQYCFLLSASCNKCNFWFPATKPKLIIVFPIEYIQPCMSNDIDDFSHSAIGHLPQTTRTWPIYLSEQCHPEATSDNCSSCLGKCSCLGLNWFSETFGRSYAAIFNYDTILLWYHKQPQSQNLTNSVCISVPIILCYQHN